MHWRNVSGLALLGMSLAASAGAASSSALADAAEHRDQASLGALLKTGADVNGTQVDGTTALHWAVYNDDLATAELLVKSGADVNAVNRYGIQPLVTACRNGNAGLVKLLLEAGANPNTTLKGGETVLMLASRSGNVDAVKALLGRDANTSARERLGQTALMWAAADGHTEVVRALIEAGADVNAASEAGFTPTLYAVRQGRLETVRELLKAGVDVNAMLKRPERQQPAPGQGGGPGRRPNPGMSLLAMAVQNAHFELAIALIEAGADPNDIRTGLTPLHMIPGVRKPDNSDGSDPAPPIGSGSLSTFDFVRELVKRGADINARLPESTRRMPGTSSGVGAGGGATPFVLAADRGDVPLMRLLIELGADPLLPTFTNTTSLMAAAGVGTAEPAEEAGEEAEALEAVTLLLDLGADINAVNDDGDTAMHGAAYNISPLVVKLLAERGADPNIWNKPNKDGVTPLFIAEGYNVRLPRPDAETTAAIRELMVKAGLPIDGERPKMVDSYAEPAPEPAKPATATTK